MAVGGITSTSTVPPITPDLIAAAAATPPPTAADLRIGATTTADGRIVVNIGEGHRLVIDEEAQTITIQNSETGTETVITGNARIDRDTKRELQFWGTTSFAFGEEGKLTLKTVPANDGSGDYMISEIAISNGDRGIVVSGFADGVAGNMKAVNGGSRIDERYRDGLLFVENEKNGVWKTEEGERMTQATLDLTAAGGTYGPGTNNRSRMEILGRALSKLLSLLARQQSSPSSNNNSNSNEVSWSDNSRSEADISRSVRLNLDRYIVEKALEKKAALPHPS